MLASRRNGKIMKSTKQLVGILTITSSLWAATANAGFSLSTTNGAYVVIPDNASMHTTNNMLTVECWFNRQTGTADWNSLVSKEPASLTFSGFDLRFGGAIPRADIQLNPESVYGTYIYGHQGNQPTSTSKWQHYAMQYDGTNYLVWIDGNLFFSTNCTAQIVIGSNPIHIGCQNSGFRPFNGWISEVRISSVGRYYRPFIPQTRFDADANTIALYHFDEGQGTTVADSSGNGNNGTIQGTGAWTSQVPDFPYLNLLKAVKPSFSNLLMGTNYQMQVSSDLVNWTNQGSAFTATNTSMVYPQYWDVENWGQLFFRVQTAP